MEIKVFGKSLLEINRASENRIVSPVTEQRSSVTLYDVMNKLASGDISVTQETALNLVPVWSCVRLLSQSIACLPMAVYRKDTSGNRMVATDHPVQRLFRTFPSPFYNLFTFREVLMAHLLLWGNAYAMIRREGARPVYLEIVHPKDVEVKVYNDRLLYKVKGERKEVLSSDIVHIVGLSFDGIKGQSPISAARDAIFIGLAAQGYGGKFFENGASVSGVLTSPGLTDEQFKRLQEQWNSKYSGMKNAGKTPILEGGTDYKTIGMPPEDAQFLQTREFSRSEIAGFFGVPPHLIGDLSRATFSNIEHQAIDFVTHSVNPWVQRIETELNRKLFLQSEQEEYYVKMNLNGLMRGDSQSRAAYYNQLFQIGIFSQNDIRRLEDMNAIEGGDRYFVPMNMTPVDKLDEVQQDNNDTDTNTDDDGNEDI
jgi:HK97 family phage portal protein